MPATRKVSREEIVDAAVAVLCDDGFSAVNARSVAKKLGCSTQPIFSYFSGMEDLKNALEGKAWALFMEEIAGAVEEDMPLLACSLTYFRFAVEQPHLFRSLFMTRRNAQEREAIGMNGELNRRMEAAVIEKDHIDEEKAKRRCTALRIYAHGLASLQAMDLLGMPQEEAEEMLRSAMKEIEVR